MKSKEQVTVTIGGKKTKPEKEWIERQAARLQQTPTWVVIEAIRAAMKKGLSVKA